jgi:hypothetical protein
VLLPVATALVAFAVCVAFTIHYLFQYPFYHQGSPSTAATTLPPATAVVLAAVLAGSVWLAVSPPRSLIRGRHEQRIGVGVALILVAGFLLTSWLNLRGAHPSGMMDYLLLAPPVVILVGATVAAAAGRSFGAGVRASAWAIALATPLLVAAWLAEAPRWYAQVGGQLLDADGGLGMGANLGDAVWWALVVLVLWGLPFGVIGAAAGGAWGRRQVPVDRPAGRQHLFRRTVPGRDRPPAGPGP